jgi:hypothetical protein
MNPGLSELAANAKCLCVLGVEINPLTEHLAKFIIVCLPYYYL